MLCYLTDSRAMEYRYDIHGRQHKCRVWCSVLRFPICLTLVRERACLVWIFSTKLMVTAALARRLHIGILGRAILFFT